MATHRAIPGANLPETGTSSTRKNRGDMGPGLGGSQNPVGSGSSLAGESGLGSGLGSPMSAGSDGFGTTGASPVVSDDSSTFGSGNIGTSSRAAGVLDQVKQQASSRVSEQKARAAEGLGSVASAIRQASEHLRTENQTLASYADTAVDQIQLFADRMREKDPAEMIEDLERFARRNPAAFVGGAFLLGIGLARFLKSSDARMSSRALLDDDRDALRRDIGASRPLGGQVGYTGNDFARADDLSSRSTLPTTPSPGITS